MDFVPNFVGKTSKARKQMKGGSGLTTPSLHLGTSLKGAQSPCKQQRSDHGIHERIWTVRRSLGLIRPRLDKLFVGSSEQAPGQSSVLDSCSNHNGVDIDKLSKRRVLVSDLSWAEPEIS